MGDGFTRWLEEGTTWIVRRGGHSNTPGSGNKGQVGWRLPGERDWHNQGTESQPGYRIQNVNQRESGRRSELSQIIKGLTDYDVQAGFRKSRGTRDQIANIHQIIAKAREFQKNICFIDYSKAFVWITTNWKILKKRWKYQNTLPASWETCMQVKKQQ